MNARRRAASSIAANPVLIGAATTLVIVVAVFLAYNANSGLPFVPTYQLQAEVPSAANLVRGNEVRIGGARIGVVDAIRPRRRPDGSVVALLSMKLETSVQPLPKDSTVLVRPRSALGLKYVEITRGDPASGGFQDGATVPLRNARPRPVEMDEVLNTFDDATRAAARTNLESFGDAFAGRGGELNRAIDVLPPLLRNLEPVMRNLAASETRLQRLFAELGDAARIVAPAAETQAELFANLDTTFAALARVARPYIQQTISGAPEALDAATQSFPVQRPFLRNTERLMAELRPGVRALRGSAPELADALEIGTPTLKRSLLLSERLIPAFRALERFADDPLVPRAIRGLTETVTSLDPTIAYLAPTQTVCNYMTLWFRNVSSLLSEGDANGTWQRFIIIVTPQGPNNEGGPSSAPADGPSVENHLHVDPYPNTAAPGQVRECEAANEPYLTGQTVLGNVPGNQGTQTEKTKVETR